MHLHARPIVGDVECLKNFESQKCRKVQPETLRMFETAEECSATKNPGFGNLPNMINTVIRIGQPLFGVIFQKVKLR